MQPAHLTPLLPAVRGDKPAAKVPSVPTSETSTSVAPVATLVTPADAQSWQAWQSARDALHRDKPEHAGLDLYQAIADDGLRERLQQMVGVDLYV